VTAPSGLKFSKTHEWVAVQGDTATVGISKFAVDLLSDVVNIELPRVGQAVRQGEPFGEIESVKHVSDLYAPVSGTVTAVNTPLANQPESIANDPYEQGWMIKLKLENASEVAELLDAAAYEAHCATESH
jgi:glycine cleavage system H protein